MATKEKAEERRKNVTLEFNRTWLASYTFMMIYANYESCQWTLAGVKEEVARVHITEKYTIGCRSMLFVYM